MKHLKLHPGLGATVLNRLHELTPLPSRGIVAGQAVASVLDHLQGYISSPINDVDVFRRAGRHGLTRTSTSIIRTVEQQQIAPVQVDTSYQAMNSFLLRMRSYRVSTVSRAGLLNFVNCTVPGKLALEELSTARVIQSFDLNCVRVGIDLATGQLVWDRHYENFLRHRRIEICTVHTPWHTFFRALKKQVELPNVTLDVEAAATIVTALYNSSLYADFGYHGVLSEAFGPKVMATAEIFRSAWDKYFHVTNTLTRPLNAEPFTVHGLEPLGTVDRDLQNRVNQMHNASLHFMGPVIHNLMKKATHRVIARAEQVASHLSARHPNLQEYFQLDPWSVAAGEVSLSHLDSVQQFLEESPAFISVFSGLTLNEQAEASKALITLKSKVPSYLFNWMGQLAMPADLRSAALVKAFFAKLQHEAITPLHSQTLNLSTLIMGERANQIQVNQLRSIADFEQSRHYGSQCPELQEVRAGTCSILELTSIEDGCEVVSALEFEMQDYTPIKLRKVRRQAGLAVMPDNHVQLRSAILKELFGDSDWQQPVETSSDDLPF